MYGFFDLRSFIIFQNTEALGNIILLAYPILDAIIIVPAVAILWTLRKGDRQFIHWILISTFIIMVTVGDIGFGYSNALGEEWIWAQQTGKNGYGIHFSMRDIYPWQLRYFGIVNFS